MFGRKGLSGAGARPAPLAPVEPVRREHSPGERIFSAELFEGKRGEFLRQMGYAPDDPINRPASQEPVAARLAEGQAELRRALAALNSVGGIAIGALHLLPPALWHGRYGSFLLKRLDLSPYRPWNTIFLPMDEAGATRLGLPVVPRVDDSTVSEGLCGIIEIIGDIFEGRPSPEAEACKIVFDSIRSNFPVLFPADPADFSGNVREGRANVRAFAILHASTERIAKEAILKSQQTFLDCPETQLTS
jgi:hypothetical protein